MMETAVQTEKLMHFGLTRQEACIYLTLVEHGELSGYEVAKLTGISRSNAYNALAGLVEKGAAYITEGSATKYISVKISEFCENKIRSMEEDKQFLIKNMPTVKGNTESYVTIEGRKHILDKMINMLRQAEYRVYLSMDYVILELIWDEIAELKKRKIKVVILTDRKLEYTDMQVYYHSKRNNQIQIITDSQNVLTGELDDACLYATQKNFVNVFKESMRNEIKLIELTKGDH